ncbi:Asp23/Gls24 family envelope stress response protein [Actinophytocola gossypii]|uniref:Asp23/Gls24 family envelope stress response protein n=1 Tax=Actinophytocola gossypii TaxID=2812003 RepID=A0ABT2JJ79_9PSEU|nr:Asp23/Gls24 family envelope stress response protein [Actinophytocola gossypii]MCT2587938.1 Asp23/Gls24 family envelope stress response protein [Actinophytocola gossypii]
MDRGTSDARDTGRAPLFEYVVSSSVVAAVAVHAAVAVPGVLRVEPGLTGLVGSVVRTARQRIKGLEPAPTEGARVEFVRADTVRVEVDVVISGQDQATAVGHALQRAVAGAVSEATGLTVAEVGVSVLDIIWD